jgi:membrane protein DedA with SNARE-associated domain
MHPAELVHAYGYLAIVVGTFFEGELVMLAAGVLVTTGILTLPGVMLAGMVGIFGSDTVCFFLGRFAGSQIGRWFPGLFSRLGTVFGMIERHEQKLIVCYQFFPGFCAVTPIAFGMTTISAARFMTLDLVGNALWTLTFSLGGYFCGAAFFRVVLDFHRWAPVIAAVLIIGTAVTLRYRRLRGPKHNHGWSAPLPRTPWVSPARSFVGKLRLFASRRRTIARRHSPLEAGPTHDSGRPRVRPPGRGWRGALPFILVGLVWSSGSAAAP